MKFGGDWVEPWLNICLLRQSWTKYLEKNKEIQ